MNSRTYNAAGLQHFCASLFSRAGVPAGDAKIIAESLVGADLRGVDSHGVVRTDIYMRRLEAGMMNTDGHMPVRQDGPVTLLDGNNHFGAVVGTKALGLSLQGAKQFGNAVVGVKGSNHFGTCAYYLLQAVQQNVVMMILSNASQTMPPTGGIRPFIGTNPFSIGVPAGNRIPFVLDMATSVVARGKIIVAAQKGESIPEGWALDRHGNMTTDAKAALEGSVLPVGGAKGYGISMFIDILCGVLTGAGFGKYVNNMYENWQEPQNVGHFFIAIDISRFMPVEQFKARMDTYLEEIKSEPKAPGVEEILIPGELEHRCTLERLEKGIRLPESVERELVDWGSRYQVDLAQALL
ncbi:Ldh family oxidoreductase [Paenibacillus thalictri]|uniref:Ldh family oxidoreductase n=1 Tax=Paenibacillus thalictri TaxID=2527873 RepID=A0A4Q9DRM5_9BACL|nr:Ldh family oxidoreductase [Paenibacillus thalictri]TBL79457.1 Ldh family oxidoreductase [Paenibacillus thalictri]